MNRRVFRLCLIPFALILSLPHRADAAATLPSPPPPGPVFLAESFGAVGDGQTLDTAALQAGVDALPVGGTLRLTPQKTYLIDTRVGLKLKSDMRLDLAGATITGVNQDGVKCRILSIFGGKRIVISGGTLVGNRLGAPTWGIGILASDAEDLTIADMGLREFHLDGILLTGNVGCRRVRVSRVVSDHNRRTGMAIVAASDVTVDNSTFSNSVGQSPEAGINAEPNSGGVVERLVFVSNTFSGNVGTGLYVHKGLGLSANDVSVDRSLVQSNGQGIVFSAVTGASVTANAVGYHLGRRKAGISLGATPNALVRNNRLDNNYRAIVSVGNTGVQIVNNTINGTGAPGDKTEDGVGIYCLGLDTVSSVYACTVSGNTVRSAGASGIVAQGVSGAQILDNTVVSPGQRGVYLRTTTGSEVRGNSVSGSGAAEPRAYDSIELAFAATGNVVANNTIKLSPTMRRPIGMGLDCVANQIVNNVVVQ